MMTYIALAAEMRRRMAHTPEPAADARAMMLGILNWSLDDYLKKGDEPVPQNVIDRLIRAADRRAAGEPIQYILGYCLFYGRTFQCDSRALIPRPETEELVETALDAMTDMPAPAVLDIGCGTGCIGISVALERPDSRVTLMDIDPATLALSRENACQLGANVTSFCGDMMMPLSGQYDVMLSNPPYIPSADMATLESHVLREPHRALDGGIDGLDCYRALVQRAQENLKPGGLLAVEVGWGQAQRVADLFKTVCSSVKVVRDLAGIDRIVWGKKRKEDMHDVVG